MHEPKLRYKADDGSEFPDWEEKKIGDIGCFIKGAGLSKADISNVGTPLILYGELYTTYSEVAYDIKRKTQAVVDDKYYSLIGDVIIPTSGESAEEISTATCVMVPGVVLGGDLNIFRSSILDGRIMSYILNHQAKWKIAAIAQGKSIVHVQAKQLANIPVRYPVSECEQQKIADFLSTIDTVIEKQKATVEAWEERKKGVMQKLFSQEVRFKADDGSEFPDWEEKKIGDLILLYDEKVSSNCKLPILTSSKKNGIEYQEEHFSGKQRHDIDGYNILPRNYCTYRNRSDGTDFTFNINRICDEGIVSKFYPVFRENNSNLFFLVMLLNNEPQTLRKIAYTAKGTGQKVLSITDLKSITVMVPCLAEQQKIADCLSALDDVIEKQKATLAAWEEMKKGLLQQMFV